MSMKGHDSPARVDGSDSVTDPLRPKTWDEFDAIVERWKRYAPAFVQEVVKGLWCIQVLRRHDIPTFEQTWRARNNPPELGQFQPYYNGYPGDHRGWERFESKEAARDFYKYNEKLITFKEFCALPHGIPSNVVINLDLKGDFIDPEKIEDHCLLLPHSQPSLTESGGKEQTNSRDP